MAFLNSLKVKPVSAALPRGGVRNDDLFIVSYPRSGNTWIRFLLANLLAPQETITFRNIEEYVPDIHKSASVLADWRGRRYIKSHHPYYDSYPKFIYIYRDGRDALVSYYHYTTEKKVFAGSFPDFAFSALASKFGSWRDHVRAALDFASLHPDRVLTLQYEHMLAQPGEWAAKVAEFAEIGCDEAIRASAVAKSSFDQLGAVEKKFGGEMLDKQWNFFRKGETGQWQQYFTGALYDRYRRENADLLLRLGYSL